jgi:minor extracellular serine protease Vpr
MKRIIITSIIFSLSCITIQAQTNGTGKKITEPVKHYPTATREVSLFDTKGMSSNTAALLLDMKKMEANPATMSREELVKKHYLVMRGNRLYANSFIMVTKNFSTSVFEEAGVLQIKQSGGIYKGLIPIEQIATLAAAPTIQYLQIGQRVATDVDSSRRVSNVNQVHQGLSPLNTGYRGKGAVVGIVDNGFDYTHPTFYDSTGEDNYRIKRTWLQNDNSGSAPAGFTYGTELKSHIAMLVAGTDNMYGDHGSHVAGIAAGSGGYPGSPYKGAAPESDVVLVSHAGTDVSIADGIEYIQNYAVSVNKPSAVNMSLSTTAGPHDGTTLADKYQEGLSGPGKLMVRTIGNNGEYTQYIEHKYYLTDTIVKTFLSFTEVSFTKRNAGDGEVHIWGEPFQNFSVRVVLYNTVTNQEEASMPYKIPANISIIDTFIMVGTNNIPSYVVINTGIAPFNNKPYADVYVVNSMQPDADRKIMLEITATDGTTKMWGSRFGRVYFTDYGYLPPVVAGVTDHNVGEGGACGNCCIVVGSYTSKNTWMPLNNVPGSSAALVGNISSFSSKGPTAHGVTKPDIVAPGQAIVSSVNSFSSVYNAQFFGTVKEVSIGSLSWYFGIMNGTSMAAPMVTGILALWLEKYPTLTREQAIEIMKKTAITDTFTGAIPTAGSNTWGWGKINAFDGLITVSVDNVPGEVSLKVYPNPVSNEVNIAFEKAAEKSLVLLCDVTGKVVYQKELSNIVPGHIEKIITDGLATGLYALKISNGNHTAGYKIVKN